MAANYLDIKGLMDVASKTVANKIKGKTTDEIRKAFDIKKVVLAEEEQVHKGNELSDDMESITIVESSHQ